MHQLGRHPRLHRAVTQHQELPHPQDPVQLGHVHWDHHPRARHDLRADAAQPRLHHLLRHHGLPQSWGLQRRTRTRHRSHRLLRHPIPALALRQPTV